MAAGKLHFAIIESRYYAELAEELAQGATQALGEAGASFERIEVPGVLELPAALAMAIDSGRYDGYVMLGCVIRGETSHYDIVANESARAIMGMSVAQRLAVGNGILTVENRDQAWVRASVGQKNKGAGAARAALVMARLKASLAVSS